MRRIKYVTLWLLLIVLCVALISCDKETEKSEEENNYDIVGVWHHYDEQTIDTIGTLVLSYDMYYSFKEDGTAYKRTIFKMDKQVQEDSGWLMLDGYWRANKKEIRFVHDNETFEVLKLYNGYFVETIKGNSFEYYKEKTV